MDGELSGILRRHLPQVHWQRIETAGVGSGVPDLNYCCDGAEGWVELKRATGRVVGVRPTQVAWIERRMRAGGRVFIMVRRDDRLWMFSGLLARGLLTRDCRLADEDGWGGGPARWPWDTVLRVLKGQKDIL